MWENKNCCEIHDVSCLECCKWILFEPLLIIIVDHDDVVSV